MAVISMQLLILPALFQFLGEPSTVISSRGSIQTTSALSPAASRSRFSGRKFRRVSHTIFGGENRQRMYAKFAESEGAEHIHFDLLCR